MSETPPLDPFGPTANPEFYVPRAATERALDQLASLLGPEGYRLVLLTGPPGMGKTQLLRMLVERLPREVAPLYLPIASLPIDGLSAFALAELRVPCVGDPAERLVERARESAAAGRRLVLLCDDASALGGAVSKLAGLVAEAGGGLAAVLACDEARAGPLRAALGPAVPEVTLTEPMSLVETTRFVRVRLGIAEIAPQLWRCFDAPTLEHVHREAQGIPRCVNQEAGALLRSFAERSLNGRQEPVAPAEVPLPPVRPPEAASPAPRREEPPIPPLRAVRSRRRRYRLLRVAELGLATLVAGLVVMLVLRSGVPPMLPFDQPKPAGEAPATASTPEPPGGAEQATAESPAAIGAPVPRAPEPPPTTASPPAAAPEKTLAEGAPHPSPPPPPVHEAAAPEPAAPATAQGPPPPPAEPTATRAPKAAKAPPPLPPVASAPPPAPAAPAAPSAPTKPSPAARAGQTPRPPAPPAAPAEAATASALPRVSVNVNADPWARVEIDGKPVGVTPLAGLSLTAGDHVFRASLPDGRTIERTVHVSADSRFVHFP